MNSPLPTLCLMLAASAPAAVATTAAPGRPAAAADANPFRLPVELQPARAGAALIPHSTRPDAGSSATTLPASPVRADALTGANRTPGGDTAEMRHRAIVRTAVPGAALPADMFSPEGRTLWDLTDFPRGTQLSVSIEEWTGPGPVSAIAIRQGPEIRPGVGGTAGADNGGSLTLFEGSEEARRWLLPSMGGAPLRPGERESLVLHARGPHTLAWRIDTEIAGIGWAHLPSGPREVVLQRALIASPSGGPGGGPSWRLAHRWIDPRAGVVAEIAGPAAPDGRSRLAVDEARVTDEVLLGAADLKIYVNQLDTPIRTAIAYGWDRGPEATVSSLTPEGYANIGALVAASTWNFSGVTSGRAEVASTSTPVNAAETCNSSKCGYTVAGAELGREDRFGIDPNQPALMKNNSVTIVEQRAGDVTMWLTAGSQNEGVSGALGEGESGFCYVTGGGFTRNQVPLYRFPNQDAGGWYMAAGDPNWLGGPGASCQQVLFNEVCGGGGFASTLYARSCGTHSGRQWGQVVKAGVVTLPSGHTFNALLIKQIADFCVYTGSSCFFAVDQVRTVNYLWQVPWLGTLARLQSAQDVPDDTSWSVLDQTDIKFGLFPPRSITVTGTTDTTITLEWDPGLDTHRISGYKVHWDTDSGGASSYAFNSAANPGQVAFNGTSATISGLTPGTPYFLTVTSLSVYTDPSSSVVTTYESLLYPSQVSGDPSFVYPVEVMATPQPPACVPTTEVGDVTVTQASGTDVQICWEAAVDPCLQGYRVIGSSDAVSAAGWMTLADAGNTTCWTGDTDGVLGQTPLQFFLVVANSPAGTGPWGHYGQ